MNFENFKNQINILMSDNKMDKAVNLLISRYGFNKVNYYFYQDDIYRVNGVYLYEGSEKIKDFELKDVMASCEYK